MGEVRRVPVARDLEAGAVGARGEPVLGELADGLEQAVARVRAGEVGDDE
ncbi:MAG: hypothetical protein U0W40_17280 [Acidimicrobiia bacterium]